MSTDKSKTNRLAELRRRAEELLDQSPDNLDSDSLEQVRDIIVQLQEYQAELEAQNDELRRAKIALEESRNRYYDLYDFAPVGYLTFDQKGLILEANLTAADMLKIDRKSLIGRRFFQFITFNDRDIYFSHRKRVFSTGNRQGCDLQLLRSDGSRLFAHLESIALPDSEGNFSQLRTSIADITRLKRTEEALRQAEERIRTFIENVDDMVYFQSQEGGLRLLNTANLKVTGYSRKEFEKDPHLWSKIIHPDDLKMIRELRESNPESGDPVEFEYRLRSKTGEWRWISSKMVGARDAEGRFTGYYCIDRDITQRKKAEEEMLRVQKLESIGLLAGGVAHDFNNILAAILGNVALVRMVTGPADESYEKLIEIENAAIRARLLTQQLHTFSQREEPSRRIVGVADLIKSASEFAVRGSNVKCRFRFPDNLHRVNLDMGQFSQAIQSIIINSDQAMPEGGFIDVTAENIVLGQENKLSLAAGDYIRIKIEDYGPGIPEADLPKVFDPFFSTRPQGTGLGLATALSIVKKHDGEIEITSKPGSGTSVLIYLPAAEGDGAVEEEKAEPEEQLIFGSGRVLIVDDEEAIRKVACTILNKLGYEAEAAAEGSRAIEMYNLARKENRPYDVVILDLTVPGGMGATETLKRLSEINPEIRAIISSGYSTQPVMVEYESYGFCGRITKPFRMDELARVMAAAIGDFG